jgi:hypothetical protein
MADARPSNAAAGTEMKAWQHTVGGQAVHHQPVLASTLTCPHCGFAATEVMATDACLYFYECKGCRLLLRPKPGDCCVFCSFGSVKCPPVQLAHDCCSDASSAGGSLDEEAT